MATETAERLDTVKTLAPHLRLSERTVHRLVDGGAIPYLRVGRQLRFNRAEVVAALRARS